MNMQRTNLYLPIPLWARMKEHAQANGYSISELVRKAIENFLATNKG